MIKYIVADLSVSSVHKLTHTHTQTIYIHTRMYALCAASFCANHNTFPLSRKPTKNKSYNIEQKYVSVKPDNTVLPQAYEMSAYDTCVTRE